MWCWVLAYLGSIAYRRQPDLLSNPDALIHFVKAQSLWIVVLAAVFAVLYLVT